MSTDPASPPGQGTPSAVPGTSPGGFAWGWFLVGLSATALVVRYVGWPLDGGQGLRAVTGGSIGVAMGGLHVEKLRRAKLGRSLSAATTVVTILLMMAASIGAVAVRPLLTDAWTARSVFKLPGLDVTAPAWNVGEKGRAFEFGRLQLDDPDGNGRFLEVHWAISDPVSKDDFAAVLQQGGLTIAETAKATVSGHEATRFELSLPDGTKRTFATAWYCPEYGRAHYVFSFLSRPRDAVLAMHQEVTASVKCHAPLGGPIPKRVFPSFTPPSGFEEQRAPNARVFTNGSESYGFNPGFSDPQMGTFLVANPEHAAKIIAGLFEAQDLKIGPAHQIRDEGGGVRNVWTGQAMLDRTPLRIVFMTWTRPGEDRTFMGFYAGPRSSDGPDPVRVLLSAR